MTRHSSYRPFLASLASALVLSSCAAETSQDEDAVLAEQVAAAGYDPATMQIVEHGILVEGDILLERDKLLAGEYERAGEPTSDGLIQKGYHSTLVSQANVVKVKLAWSTTYPVNQSMKDRFINAAGDFNSVVSKLVLSQNNAGPAITVHLVPDATLFGFCKGAPSCANPPSSGKPGANVYMRKEGFSETCTWTTGMLDNRARHELNHAFGLEHPGKFTHIAGTKTCTNPTPSKCEEAPGYPTVMLATAHAQANCSADSTTPTVLQTDDRKSVTVLYPE